MQEFSTTLKGINSDLNELQNEGSIYSFVLNATTENASEPQADPYRSNMASNVYCYELESGDKVVGHKYIPELEKTILLVWNATTHTAKAIDLKIMTSDPYKSDTTTCVGSTDTEYIIHKPQCSSIILFSTTCFDWSQSPKVIYKLTDCTLNLYINNGIDEDRLINFTYDDNYALSIDKEFLVSNNVACNPVYNQVIDCNKTKWNPIIEYPCIELELIPGGKVKGSYSYMVAYSTYSGIPLTSFKSLTQPFHIEEDGGGIKINLSNVTQNSRYKFITIVCNETINETTTHHKKATISINQKQYIDVENGGPSISNESLVFEYPFYKSSDDITESNNILFKLGVNEYEKFNLQPVINLVELEWISVVAKEGDYKKPRIANQFKSFLRDEVYPLGIELLLDNGEKGPTFPFVGRAKRSYDIYLTNTPTQDACNPLILEEWQQSNTASIKTTSSISLSQLYDDCSCKEIYQTGEFSYWQSTETYPNNPTIWGDLCGTPIRHFKFPDIQVSPHQSDNSNFNELNYIFPLGVRIINDMASVFDLAVSQGLITQTQRNRIVGYKIVRGDRIGNKSIIGKGLLYDVWSYTRENEKDDNFANDGCSPRLDSTYYYPNYPYNDLSPDIFLARNSAHYEGYNMAPQSLQTVPTLRDKFTFHSPETSFDKPLLGSLLKYEAELSGKARGFFNKSEEFAGYKLPSARQYDLAKVFASTISSSITTPTEEALSGFASNLGQSIGGSIPGIGNMMGALGGFVGNIIGTNIAKNSFSSIAYRHSVFMSTVEKVIHLFQQLAPYQQHHYQHQSVGRYNRISTSNGGITISRKNIPVLTKEYLEEGKQTIIDNNNTLYFNNKDRESSVFFRLSGSQRTTDIKDNSRTKISDNTTASNSITIQDENRELFSYKITVEDGFYKFRITDCEGDTYLDPEVYGQNDTRIRPLDMFCVLSYEIVPVNFLGWKKKVDDGELTIEPYINECKACKELTTVTIQYPCNCNADTERNIASFYVSNKTYLAAQYGSLYDIKWIDLNSCGVDFTNRTACDNKYFGGDTFIGRFSLKRKHNFFSRNTFKLPDGTGFNYSIVPNVAYPVYFFNTIFYPKESIYALEGISYPLTTQQSTAIKKLTNLWKFGLFASNKLQPAYYKFDCFDTVNNSTETKKFQVKPISGIIYTYVYGVPSFICESSINLDLREQKENPWDKFYPKESNLQTWLQEVNVPIKLDNTYHYNKSFSKLSTESFKYMYDINFKGLQECKTKHEQRVIYSAQSLNIDDSNYSDNYLVNKALDYFDFSKKGGKAISIEGIEGDKVLVRMENTTYIYSAAIQLNSDVNTVLITTGNIFSNRPVEFSSTTGGYFGSQHKAILHTPHGHISVDAKRGHVFLLANGGQGLEEISNKGLRHWFKENLPFNLKRQFPEVNEDDNFNGLGIALSYDKKFEQFHLTKLDYEAKTGVTYDGTNFKHSGNIITLGDRKYFKDKSWTVSYAFYKKEWVSYHSWIPKYYIDEIDTFLTGNDKGVWQHNITNKSYQVFYNKLHPFIVETLTKARLNKAIVKSVGYYADFVRYHNSYDYYIDQEAKFDSAIVYGKNHSSGELLLDNQPENYTDRKQYPILQSINSRVILNKKEGQHTFNQFKNRTKPDYTKLPLFLGHSNNVDKMVNLDALTFDNKMSNDYIRDNNVKVRLTQSSNTRNKIIFKGITVDFDESWR